MTKAMVDFGEKPYNYQSSYMIVDLGATWAAASGNFSVSGYARNALDEEYKAGVALNTTGITNANGVSQIGVTPGAPLTVGVMVNVKF
jgi:outer membrane receptor protein involved in Fe transport